MEGENKKGGALQGIGDIVQGISNVIVTSPNRIGLGTNRKIHYDLYGNNDSLMRYLSSMNGRENADFVYRSNIQTNSNNTLTTILIIVMIMAFIYFINKNNS